MRKLIVLLLTTLLMAGCVQTQELGKGVGQVGEELGITEYDMKVGSTVTVDGKQIRLESFDADYITIFDVDGDKREMRETQDPQIVNGIELTILPPYSYDATDVANNYVKVKIVKYVPKQDEYLFYLNEEKNILGYTVELSNLYKDGTILMTINRANEKRVMEGKTETVNNLYITNVRPNFRAISYERYAIVKITEKA